MIQLRKEISLLKSLLRKNAVMDEAVGMFQQGRPQISILGGSDFCVFSHYSLRCQVCAVVRHQNLCHCISCLLGFNMSFVSV